MSFDLSEFRLNSPLGKRILAAVREGDYAHPGEEEAIHRTLHPYVMSLPSRWLDVGCGRGGTAAYVSRQGWAHVTGFDIDAETITENKASHPEVEFFACGVEDAPKVISSKFDLLYLFNSFYAFSDQPAALCALRPLVKDAGRLVVFDYVDRGGFYDSALPKYPEGRHWRPLHEASFAQWLNAAGWQLEDVRNLDGDYVRWYEQLVKRFDVRREVLLKIAPMEAVDYAKEFYSMLLEIIRDGVLGGGIFSASTLSRS